MTVPTRRPQAQHGEVSSTSLTLRACGRASKEEMTGNMYAARFVEIGARSLAFRNVDFQREFDGVGPVKKRFQR